MRLDRFTEKAQEALQEAAEQARQNGNQALDERKIALIVTGAAKTVLIGHGWDPVYGARPLKRAIQRIVQDPLAMSILEGRFGEGDAVEVDAKDGKLVFKKAKAAAAASVA